MTTTGAARTRKTSQADGPRFDELARLVVLASRRRALRDEFAARVEPLRRGGIVPVDGEVSLLSGLDQSLSAADAALTRIPDAPADGARLVGEIGHHLRHVDWDLAELLLEDLHEREQTHRATGQQMQEEVDLWRAEITRLRPLLDEAVDLDALVAAERDEFLIIESLVMQAARAVGDGMYSDAATPLHRLRTGRVPGQSRSREPAPERTVRKPDELLEAVDKALVRAKELAAHTELVLLRTSPAEAEDIEYVAILRVPRASVTHTVSVRATRTLARSDFEHIRTLTKRVGTAEGRRRGQPARHITPAALADTAPAVRDDDGSVCKELRILGDLMYRLVIPESVQRSLEEHVGQVTITTNEQELPWELIRVCQVHLASRCPVARMPLGWTMPRLGQARGEGRRLRFLLWHSDPTGDLPGAKVEVETIRDGLKSDWGQRIEVDVVGPEDATSWRLNETLLTGDYDVVHFAGHARFDEARPDQSGLLLKDSVLFPAGKIEWLLTGQPLVFLNACESSMAANEPDAPSYVGHQSEGLASAFLYGGAVACVGSRWPVFDRSAGEFAVTFYKHLLQGNMVGEALRLARTETYATRGDEVTWATYALYGDPGFHITTPGAAGAPSAG